ncbi:MAG: DNA polymerase III subunit delta [Bacteroidota bacterium]|nr:DNA polymerase III subunit delta [Bacteroidota bacterium]
MTTQEIIGNIKKKIYHPIYLLHGAEPFFIDQISDYIEDNAQEEEFKAFNQTVVYGKDVDISNLISIARQFPMGAPFQVIIVKEAQDIKKIEELERYAEKPANSTILVLCYKHKKPDKRTRFYKFIAKNGVVFEAKKVYDNKIPAWITQYLKERGHEINIKSTHLLNEYLGNDLSKITNELDKLLINIPKGEKITEEDIEKNIGISKDYNIFELQDALARKDVLKANRIINYFKSNPKENPPVKTVTILYSFFIKVFQYHFVTDKADNSVAAKLGVAPFTVRNFRTTAGNYSTKKLSTVMALLLEYDLKAKGVNNISTDGGELIRELVYKILH